ncbi:MAG: hypothetical protein C0502_06800 [Opitutus sp.]|nr:hypothetical protein [Opitutus sp.]
MMTARRLPCRQLGFFLAAALIATAEPLTLEETWQRVLAVSSEERVFVDERAAIGGEALQAGLLPNPSLSSELQEVGVKRPYRGFDDASLTVQVRQEYVRKTKRDTARNLAAARNPVAEADYVVRVADLRQRVVAAYRALQVAQERVRLAGLSVEIARRTADAVQRQSEAGQASGLDLSRARLQFATETVRLETATVARSQAQRALAAQWGERLADGADLVAVTFNAAVSLSPLEKLQDALATGPDLRRLGAEAEFLSRAVDYEKSRNVRDIGLTGGVRYGRRGADATALFGVEIPLLVNTRNEGGIAAARARERQLEHRKAALRLNLEANLATRHAELVTASREARALEQDILPAAEEVVARNEAALDQGQGSLLQVLEAQRALLDARERRLDAVERQLAASVALERLTGHAVLP